MIAGLKLIEAKRRCGHGAWLAWLRANVRVSKSQAYNYMSLAKLPVTGSLDEAWRTILGNGAWLAWLRANVRVSQQQASNYMRLAKLPVTGDLPDQWRTILGNGTDDDDCVITESPAPSPASAPRWTRA